MKKKSIIIPIVLLVVGFAAVSTTIILNGKVGVGTNQDNYIDGVVFDEESLTSSEGTTAKISKSGRTITFTTQEMKTVGEEAKVNFKIKNYSQYNAVLGTPAISCYFVDNHEVDIKATQSGTTHEYMQLIPGSELNGTTINAGGGISAESSVTVKQIKSYVEDTPSSVKFQCEINTSGTDSETPGIEKPSAGGTYELTNDVNSNGIADIGDEIQVGTESFYVISHTDSELNALAKYNLNVGSNKNPDVTEGIQHETVRGLVSPGTTYGNVKFSNQKGWPQGADTIDIRNQTYGDGTIKDALYGANGYEVYIKGILPDTESRTTSLRLITKGEIEELINEGVGDNFKSKADYLGYTWLYSTSYWTQSVHSVDVNIVWNVYSDGAFGSSGFSIGSSFGVRPVITISLS